MQSTNLCWWKVLLSKCQRKRIINNHILFSFSFGKDYFIPLKDWGQLSKSRWCAKSAKVPPNPGGVQNQFWSTGKLIWCNLSKKAQFWFQMQQMEAGKVFLKMNNSLNKIWMICVLSSQKDQPGIKLDTIITAVIK